MKKLFIITGIAVILTASFCTVALASVWKESETAVYRGEKWHFDIEEKEYPYITIIPENRIEPQVYGNGYVEKIEQEQKKYEIVLLGK